MGEKIKILLNKEATKKEIADLKSISIFCGLTDCSVENSGGSREFGVSMPPEVFIVIKYSVGALVLGLFGAIGVDLWNTIKKFVIESFTYYKDPNQPYLYNPDIYIEIKEKNELKIQIIFLTRKFTKQELKKSLQKLDSFLKKNKLTGFSSIYFSKGRWRISNKKFRNQEESFRNLS